MVPLHASVLAVVFIIKGKIITLKRNLNGFYSKQSVLGDNFYLQFKAALNEDNPTSLSMLGYIEITSHETNNIPAGNGEKRRLISSTFSRAVVSARICGSFLIQGCKKYSVNTDKFSTAVPFPEVINRIGLFSLCVLIKP